MSNVHILQHPLGSHILTHLRDKTTKPALFRTLAQQITLLLSLEATRNLPMEDRVIDTPLLKINSPVLAKSLTVIPILRSGLSMVEAFTDMFPDVSVGYVGLERDHTTAQARSYYCKLPPLAGTRTFILDPMLATGGSAIQAIQVAQQHGATDIAFVAIIASQEGIAKVQAACPDVDIFVGCVDPLLNANKYIVPGLGDFGDRLYGT